MNTPETRTTSNLADASKAEVVSEVHQVEAQVGGTIDTDGGYQPFESTILSAGIIKRGSDVIAQVLPRVESALQSWRTRLNVLPFIVGTIWGTATYFGLFADTGIWALALAWIIAYFVAEKVVDALIDMWRKAVIAFYDRKDGLQQSVLPIAMALALSVLVWIADTFFVAQFVILIEDTFITPETSTYGDYLPVIIGMVTGLILVFVPAQYGIARGERDWCVSRAHNSVADRHHDLAYLRTLQTCLGELEDEEAAAKRRFPRRFETRSSVAGNGVVRTAIVVLALLVSAAGPTQAQFIFGQDCTTSLEIEPPDGNTWTLIEYYAARLEPVVKTLQRSAGQELTVLRFGERGRVLYSGSVSRRERRNLKRVYSQLREPCPHEQTDLVGMLEDISHLIQRETVVVIFTDGLHSTSDQRAFYRALSQFGATLRVRQVRAVAFLGLDERVYIPVKAALGRSVGSRVQVFASPAETIDVKLKQVLALVK